MRRLALAALAAVACGSSGTTPAPSVRDAASDVASVPVDTGTVCSNIPDYASASDCNTVPNTALAVAFSDGAGERPTFTGGTIVDGLYQASKVEGWNASNKMGRQMTLVVAEQGTKIFWSGDVLAGSDRANLKAITTVAPSGNQLALTVLCLQSQAAIPATMTFTATPTQLVLAAAQNDALTVTTYTRVGCP